MHGKTNSQIDTPENMMGTLTYPGCAELAPSVVMMGFSASFLRFLASRLLPLALPSVGAVVDVGSGGAWPSVARSPSIV